MSIVSERAEQVILRELKILRSRNEKRICIDLNTKDLPTESLTKILDILKRTLSDQDMSFYICFESLFVIANDIPFKSFLKIQKIVASVLNYNGLTILDVISIFDLEKDWKKIKILMNNKIIDKELYSRGELNHILRHKNKKDLGVLIVDDDIFTSKLIREAIRSPGIKFSIANNGKDAIYRYIRETPDVVFLDIELPDINGYDVFKKIKKINPDAFIVMLSGNDSIKNISLAADLEAHDFITKPFSRGKLMRQIDAVRKNVEDRQIA